MKINDWLTVLAILLAPLVAIQVSMFIERRKERRQRQLALFRTLMTTRASGLAPDHVTALNTIDIEFYAKDAKSKAVLSAWKAYLDHLSSGDDPPDKAWHTRREDLLIDLLHQMAIKLGYDFDKTAIRRTVYFPKGYGDVEGDQFKIRKGLVSVLEGKKPIAVTIEAGSNPPAPEENQFFANLGKAISEPKK